jgi:[FeFe] hydrogenase H-cluster maturation GTPase HydF
MQVLRELLDHDIITICITEQALTDTLENLKVKPYLIITDSKVVDQVCSLTPEDIHVTTFSILFARYRGELAPLLEGIKAFDKLKPSDKVLIIEACSHDKTCDDIGTVKLPNWIKAHLCFSPNIVNISGGNLPDDLKDYSLVVHCGGCMINRAEMMYRISECQRQAVPVTNYGLLISHIHGKLERVTRFLIQ